MASMRSIILEMRICAWKQGISGFASPKSPSLLSKPTGSQFSISGKSLGTRVSVEEGQVGGNP